MYVCVVVCLGWGCEGVIVSYKLTQKHVSPYRMVSVYVCVCSFRMQINDRLHVINNVGPVMQLSSADVLRLSVRQLDYHTQLGVGVGGGGGSQRVDYRGQKAGAATLCPLPLHMSI